jgi:twitching motility protein PilT
MEMENLLKSSVTLKASDLHMIPGLAPCMRIDGVLAAVKNAAVFSSEDTKRLIYSILSEDQKKDFEEKLVIDIGIYIPKLGNFRASVYHQLHGVAAVFRIVPKDVPNFDTLGLPPVLKSLLGLSYGLILVTGATGSGKSTTIAAMIEYINTFRACNIVTIEDPIEFIYKSKKSIFNQVQVGRDTPDFSTALRASLRQDPNVILLGELRDLETMRLALTAAETGHLVLATMHASTAPIAVSRFADVFPSEEKNMVRTLLSETLQAVICQALVKRVSGGRVAAFEIMLAIPAIRHFIRQDMLAHMESAMQINGDKGMCTLDQYLQGLVVKREVSATVANTLMANRGSYKDTNNLEK